MIPLGPVVARSRLRAPRSAAWSYLVDPGLRAEWWPELSLVPGVGGAVAERWTEESGETSVSRDASGEVDVWVDGHAIGFTWREAGDERPTAVLVTLRSQGAETGITVTETGFDALPSPAERAAASQEGWEVLLRDLAAAIDAAVAAGTLAAPAPEAVPAAAPAPEAAAVDAGEPGADEPDAGEPVAREPDADADEPDADADEPAAAGGAAPAGDGPEEEILEAEIVEDEDGGAAPVAGEPAGGRGSGDADDEADRPRGEDEEEEEEDRRSSGDPDFDDLIRGVL